MENPILLLDLPAVLDNNGEEYSRDKIRIGPNKTLLSNR
jgi:hypothetical protein